MAFDLIETVRSFITPDVEDRAATHLGEGRDGISKAISGIIPALFAGFVSRAESGDAQGLLTDAREASRTNLADSSASLFTAGRADQPLGTSWISNLFGGRLNSLVNSIASFAGIKNGSASSLLNLLAPLSLGVLGQHAIDRNLDAGGLSSFLASQKNSILSALPAGLNIANLFGAGARPTATTVESHMRETGTAVVDEPRRNKWLWPVLLGLAALALILYLLGRGCNGDEVATTTTTTDTTTQYTAPVTTDTATTVVTTRESTKVRLVNNAELDAYRGGVEERLVNCLNDPACQAGKDQWFDFDNINFETGSARLTPESQAQVTNIVAILKAYPKAKIKIGGYTDKTGNEPDNKKLSLDRAQAITAAIKAGGIGDVQLEAPEGYGSDFAKVPATASDEERRVDRRISVQLREKG
jgi:OmpA-OmpF porin, OOP family